MINHRTQKLHAQQVLEHLAYGLAQPIALPRETIEEVLREAIMDGRLEPGERLTQQAIANAFQVSRMPVREALRSLETQGYIATEYHKSYRVTNGHELPQCGHLPGLLRCVAERHTQLGDLESKVAFENEILHVLGRLRPTSC
ncbi:MULTISPECIES: GntR family transcriptional regulator [Pseudomonas syringae group]|uniref:GntR family transcriptional regulator n=3 Tax=Pseudomonas syringae group TaxID=136849 RepID=A0AAW4E6P3_PSESX|nr:MULTISPECIES: GntR family transcriptional regulator [Pseudomonas syringae group]AVB12250.1 GntR family transcriptional regulator [Pseudomonas amygdali pv. morsprunorum]KUR42757.1 transcriptional regulator PdhR [Pseudomonas syringae pv. tomato]KUR48268.1 transcriptional regulator PdhR [Pseudomonas syringae pv. tomato]KWS58596.1 GntR family transcriptional regulator [Pseudomonas amygdali pv. morsprunorum]MBH0138560.1 GntR family transcriptional regulator [Pseudomonas syringae pv. tomato]